ncbi:MAG: APC family permease [Alicyclobacillus sp.]|nr:APC family permease [Alicyclobacillus sp.]
MERTRAPHTGLRRSLTYRQGIPLAMGAVLGPGILAFPALVARQAGPASLLSWAFMSLLAIALAFTLGRLGVRIPDAGGIAAYAGCAFGPAGRRIASWLFLGSLPFAIPVFALIGAESLGTWLGLGHWAVVGIALAMVLGSALLNVTGLRGAGRVQTAVIAVVTVLLLALAAAGATQLRLTAFSPFLPHGWTAVGEAAVVIFLPYVGFEMVVHLTEEFRQPARDLPVSLCAGAGVVSVLYIAIAFVTVGALPQPGVPSAAALTDIARRSLGPAAGAVTAAVTAGCAFGTVHVNLAGFSRLLYAQARAGELPGWLAGVHPRFATPVRAIGAQAAFSLLLLLYAGAGNPGLATLVRWPSLSFTLLYAVAMAAAWRLLPKHEPGRWTALATLLLCACLFPFGGWTCLYPLAIAAGGGGFACWPSGRGARRWRGPGARSELDQAGRLGQPKRLQPDEGSGEREGAGTDGFSG